MDRLRQEEMKNINLKSLKFAKTLYNVNQKIEIEIICNYGRGQNISKK